MAKSVLVDFTCQAMRRESGERREDRKCYEKTKANKQNVNEREGEGGKRKEKGGREKRNAREGIGMFMTYVFICFAVAVYLFV